MLTTMNQVLSWLLQGDVSIQYQTQRYLLQAESMLLEQLQKRIETEGFGAQLLSARNENGHWGIWYYQPKWTCTHYTLCDLKGLGLAPSNPIAKEMVERALTECQLKDGGLNFAKSDIPSDIAINGMFLAYASYFCPKDARLAALDLCIRSFQKPDGGFSWDYASPIGDPHTTICVLEGLYAYRYATQGTSSIDSCLKQALQCLYQRNLCIGEDPRYIRMAYPYRYRYDLLRFLEFAANAQIPWNESIEQALVWLVGKQHDGVWNLQLVHPGKVHVQFEQVHQFSRFITVKAIQILMQYAQASKTAEVGLRRCESMGEETPVPSVESTGVDYFA